MVRGLKQIHKVGLAHRRLNSKFIFLSGDYDNYIVKIGGCAEAWNIVKPIDQGGYLDQYEEDTEDLFKLGHEPCVSTQLCRRKRDKKHFICKKVYLLKIDAEKRISYETHRRRS